MEELDIWMRKLEVANNKVHLPNVLYRDIKKYVEEAFIYDFNLLIEEFDFYMYLPPNIQNEIIQTLFSQFKNNFQFFFNNTDVGF